MRKNEIIMNKPVYLGLSILDLSKIVLYEVWYDYVKPNGQNAKFCYMDKDRFIIHVKTDDIYKDFFILFFFSNFYFILYTLCYNFSSSMYI